MCEKAKIYVEELPAKGHVGSLYFTLKKELRVWSGQMGAC